MDKTQRPGHIHPEEDRDRYDSLLERYPWTRRYYDWGMRPFEEVTGWFDPKLALNDFPGWSKVFEKTCGRIQEVLDRYNIPSEQFVIEQVKEKFAKIRLYWGFYEIGEDGFPDQEIGKSGMVIDFLGVGTLSGVGGQSAEEAGYDKKYDLARKEISEILKEIAEESYGVCIFCGSTEDIGYTTGWVMPVCSKCKDAGIEGRMFYRHIVLGKRIPSLEDQDPGSTENES